jgi:hypothetical protein
MQPPTPVLHCPHSAMFQAVCFVDCLPLIHEHPWTCDATQTSWIRAWIVHQALFSAFAVPIFGKIRC